MRLYSFACLVCVFVVMLDSVTCYPAADPADSTNGKRHNGLAHKKHRTSKTNHRHSSRGESNLPEEDF